MRKLSAIVALLAFTLTVGVALAADPAAPGEDFMAAAAQAAKVGEGLKSYQIKSSLTMDNRTKGSASGMKFEAEVHSAGIWPDYLLSVISSPVFQQNIGTGPDGSWFYISQLQACYQGPAQKMSRTLDPDQDMGLTPAAIFNFLGGVGDLLLEADLPVQGETGAEDIEVAGRQVPCQVFNFVGEDGSRGTYWHDPDSGLVLQARLISEFDDKGVAMEREMFTRVKSFTLNGDVSLATFAPFTPPEGVRVVDNFELLLNPDSMVGQMAPDIEFTDFKGGKSRLADYRGKVVFLDFWATWCGPCRMEMPHIQALHEEMSGAGEVVFLGASSETQPTIEKFLAKNPYTFGIFMVNDADAKSKFKVTSIPAGFVIDREGRIQAHMIGAQSEAQLRAALAKAGL